MITHLFRRVEISYIPTRETCMHLFYTQMHIRDVETFTLSESVIVGIKQVVGVGPICQGNNIVLHSAMDRYLVMQNHTK
jgi:hypothetical protein